MREDMLFLIKLFDTQLWRQKRLEYPMHKEIFVHSL